MPWFLLKTIFFFMFIGFIFRMIWWRGYSWGRWNNYGHQYKVAMADKIRNIEPVAVLFEGRLVHGTLK